MVLAYDAVCLCSAMVLEEHRRVGLAKRSTLDALERIRKDHPINALFCWPFTAGGDALAGAIALEAALPLRMRADRTAPSAEVHSPSTCARRTNSIA
jgi:hypothetical protein